MFVGSREAVREMPPLAVVLLLNSPTEVPPQDWFSKEAELGRVAGLERLGVPPLFSDGDVCAWAWSPEGKQVDILGPPVWLLKKELTGGLGTGGELEGALSDVQDCWNVWVRGSLKRFIGAQLEPSVAAGACG
ncbi:hypothetical protein NDU88_001270 [Pleurodeles waltl]|uniref:Uncharacterized protein n=1 Tax=Pleurodeles waltl TaxID=8319 RepID=A0AAV7UWC8_PLEWA|nr:hypothetical protein NDU88_001270 [Pleurodeles waltl]